jgi:integrase
VATIRQRASGSWEIIIRRKGILPKAHYATADSVADAVTYAKRIEGQLDQGILPVELQDIPPPSAETVLDWARMYLQQVHISEMDTGLLNAMFDTLKNWPVSKINIQWAQSWVSDMKQRDKLAPSSIRHKVGAVARLLDWCVRNEWLIVNPLRSLPKKYATYTPGDGDKREDIERDRRLQPGEEERILWVLAGNFPPDRQRGINMADRLAITLLFTLAIETAMRLREMYTLTVLQVDLAKKTVFLDKTKNGDKRQVPLSSVALSALTAWLAANDQLKDGDQLIFPWWDGKPESLKRTTAQLSRNWSTISDLAGCADLRFHDLRHEAVCRLYERTTLGDVLIARITGHKDLRNLKRYSSLRGSDLAEMLW